jgi:hypothetical protein
MVVVRDHVGRCVFIATSSVGELAGVRDGRR